MKGLFFALLLLSLTPSVNPKSIGTPCSGKGWYARNVWAMTYYDNRLFVGCGNSSNNQPSSNAGPVNVWTYQDSTGWRSEFTVDDEQIDRFVLLDGVLTIPGHDAREGWRFGNWYTRAADGWEKHRNIPDAIHVYDITEYDGVLFAGIGGRYPETEGSIAVSEDNGQSWRLQLIDWDENLAAPCSVIRLSSPRIYNFFTIDDALYANPTGGITVLCDHVDGRNRVEVQQYAGYWNGRSFEAVPMDLFGQSEADRVEYPTVYAQKTVYIAAQTVNDHQWIPLGVSAISGDFQAQPVTIPLCTRPQALEVSNGVLYALCNEAVGGNWQVNVMMTCDLAVWESVISFTEPTFARSFAIAPEAVYFGLGGDTDMPKAIRVVVGQVLASPTALTGQCAVD